MAHYKNRRPKGFTGCCRMCALRDHVGGMRNKRMPTRQEQTAPDASDMSGAFENECDAGTCDGCLNFAMPGDDVPTVSTPPLRVPLLRAA